jgi:hypothetical protein
MATFFVEMYQASPVMVEVEADTPERAGEIGEELIRNGMGRVNPDSVSYHPDRTVYTEDWDVAGSDLF